MILTKEINRFEKNIKFKFKNKNNLLIALLHPSYIKEKKTTKNYLPNEFERLEFLGDRVLGLVISSLIFNKFKSYDEGDLTKKFSYLVQKNFLHKIALELNMDKFLKYSIKKYNKKNNISILADSMESLIGSIFIDSGYSAVVKFIKYIWGPYLDLEASNIADAKTMLQEISQKKYKILPIYKLVKKEGPSHSPIFTISVEVKNLKIFKAKGSSKREAEKKAAELALVKINEKNY